MNVLVIAPHPDDESIGCGGTLYKHFKAGDRVSAVFLTSGELGLKHIPRQAAWKIRETEALRAGKILGIAESNFLRLPDWTVGDHVQEGADRLVPVLKRVEPELIYLPHPLEWHPDHQASSPVLRAALRRLRDTAPELRGYEVWTPLSRYDHVENIADQMPWKLRALRCHASQLAEFDYVTAVRGLNQFRGELAARCRFAEVFQSQVFQSQGDI
jgi:N-acetylglucosamine malate deacetylase 1